MWLLIFYALLLCGLGYYAGLVASAMFLGRTLGW